MSTTILLVDDHPVFRKGLRLLLDEEPDMTVVGEAGDGREAIDRVRDLSPDVVVMDISMPNLNGIDATRRIISESPATKVVALSIHGGKRFVEDMLRAGAAGYILKESAPEELVKGIRAVAQGEVYLSPSITGVVVSQYVEVLSHAQASGESAELTERERTILQLATEGHTTQEIASGLQISTKTAASTRRRVMEKLGVKSIAELTAYGQAEAAPKEEGYSPADEAAATPILRTKLHRPPIFPDLVPRVRLLEQLEKGRRGPLTLVSAPAGYGKSTLVSQWLEACDCPSGWVSLDESDNDLYQFLSYLLYALRTVFTDAVPKTLTLVNAATQLPLKVLVGSLVNELDLIEQGFMLVLDDFHLIHEKSVHDLLAELLRHPPKHMHLVLVGRRDPFLPISMLRARNQVTEIRMNDLCFTAAETAAYLQQILDKQIEETTAAAWTEKTEGWVTGLRLAALSLRHGGDPNSILSELHGSAQYVMEYLFNEVLSHQPPGVRRYLLSTSILDRFCAPLCDVLCGPAVEPGQDDIDSWDFINHLKKENLFIINLDEENRWFRYHHLFQHLLQNQLERQRSPEEIAALHSRASVWFAENGFHEEALHNALTADDIPYAVQVVEKHRHSLLNGEQWSRLERILGMFPDQIVETHPELLVMKAWIFHHLVRFREMVQALDHAEPLIADGPSEIDKGRLLRAEIDAMRGNLSYFEADGQRAMSHTQQALDRIPQEHALARGQATLIHCAARQMIGDPTGALEMAHALIAADTLKESAFNSRRLFSICYVYWMEGDLSALRQIADQLLKHSQKWNLPESMAGANYFLGIVSYHRNQMPSAEKYLAQAVGNLYLGQVLLGVQSCLALSLAHQSQGRTEKAREAAAAASAFASDRKNAYGIMTIRAFEAELALLQGRLSEARGWARQFNPEPFRSMPWFYVPQLTLAKALLAQDTPESRQKAADVLDRLHEFVLSIHNTRFRIDVLALQALLHDARGEGPVALEKLTESLALAEPGGFIRNFVDLGPPMADLLKRLIKKNVAVEYIDRILAAFRDDEQVGVPEASDAQAAPAPSLERPPPRPPVSPSPPPPPLDEPLTNRELQILELLAQRLQNKEIAEELFISVETVKAHLKSIYLKLDVSTRRQAITRAKALGILTGN